MKAMTELLANGYGFVITPHTQHEQGKVIGVGVHIYNIYIYSILHILTIVFPGTRTVEYQPIFHGVT